MSESLNRVTIDLAALKQNYAFLRQRANAPHFLSMVKADAYGHGNIRCAEALAGAGCTVFGVAELNEAVTLREAGVAGTILVMAGVPEGDAAEAVANDVTPLVYDTASLKYLSQAAVRQGREITVHFKVNTGMCRLGFELDQMAEAVALADSLPGVKSGGIVSHFPEADTPAAPSTLQNFARFKEFAELIGPDCIRHIANSGATLYFPQTHWDMVRCGISLYGYFPEGKTGHEAEMDLLRPVMRFSTRVLQVREVAAGVPVSYGGTYVTERASRLAVLPVGYSNGFPRGLSNCGEVLIRGKRAPVRGRVCMNLCMVDVTDIDGVAAGDEVVILGRQGDDMLDADDMAAKVGTISYELLCLLGCMNSRYYLG